MQKINKREKRKEMREENREIYMAREREKKRDRDRPNKPGAISSVSGALFCKEHKQEGGGKKRRKEEESKNILESVYKENENTHTPEGWGHSQNAREVQQSRRLHGNTSLCL